MRQLPLPIAVDPAPSFDSFVAGGNALALAALRRLARGDAPVYLWGPQGSGKSHLLRAAAAERRAAGAEVGCFDAASAPPWRYDERWELVVYDGCDAWDAARQHEAFALFVEAAEHGVPVAAAGRLPPVDLPLRDDLRTRLAWGQVIALQPLGDDGSRAALRSEAAARGIALPDEVIGYLMARCARDLKSLMELLARLDLYALVNKRAITVPLVRRMLAEPAEPAEQERA